MTDPQHCSPENELADRLYNYVKKYNGDWATASPALSWDDMDTIIGALRRHAQRTPEQTDAEIEAWIRTLDDQKDRNLVRWMERALRAEKELSEINGKLFAKVSTLPSTDGDSPVMGAAKRAAKVVDGWSDAKRDYADRVTSTVREVCQTCMGSGYSNHPDSGEICHLCKGQGEVTSHTSQNTAPIENTGE